VSTASLGTLTVPAWVAGFVIGGSVEFVGSIFVEIFQ